jgi:hypothetical protein
MNFIETMTGMHGALCPSAHAVEPDYLHTRLESFASKYPEFSHWSIFFAAYSKKELSRDNLDFHEWAFLCEQILYEETESSPPNGCGDSKVRPEIDSGLSSWRAKFVRSRSLFY